MSDDEMVSFSHGETDESGSRHWCWSCKTFVPEPEWDVHKKHHQPEECPSCGFVDHEDNFDTSGEYLRCPACGKMGVR